MIDHTRIRITAARAAILPLADVLDCVVRSAEVDVSPESKRKRGVA